jgi:integrative and conjugative element protein (TIGR02256 family)
MIQTPRKSMPALNVRLLGIERFEGHVLLQHNIREHLEREALSSKRRTERGGVFIGQYRGPHIEITDFTIPGPTDLSAPTSFTKIDPIHQIAAERAWQSSGQTKTYIGEWHTHPSGRAAPSFTDRHTWSNVAKQIEAFCIFAIVAPNEWALFVTEKKLAWTVTKLEVTSEGARGLVLGTI